MYNRNGDRMTRDNIDLKKLSPMMLQYIEVKEKNENSIIFFRVGDFYEMFFEDAILVARLLELTLTSKSAGLEEKIPMCGIPHHAYLNYAKRLVDLGYRVAICEQLQNAQDVKGIVKRDIVQILSKGTIINEESLVSKDNNYIAHLMDLKYSYLITYSDISTGENYVVTVFYNKLKLINEISNLGIKELLVNKSFDANIIEILKEQYDIMVNIIEESNDVFEYDIFSNVESELEYHNIKKSFNYLIGYLVNCQKMDFLHLQNVKFLKDEEYLKMDIHSKRNLELIENIRSKEKTYSLLWLLDNTKTSSGARLLKKWIEKPILNEITLEKRYDMISNMLDKFIETEELRNYLKDVYDIERLTGRVAFDTANGRDLIQLKKTLKNFPYIEEIFQKINFEENLDDFKELYSLLEESIYEEPPILLKEGYLIKDGYNSDLDELKEIRNNSKNYLLNLTEREKEKTGIKNLKIGYNKNFGYYIEITNGSKNLVKDEFGYIRKQTLANCERYITQELKELEEKILSAEDKIIKLEYELFIGIRNSIKSYISLLQKNAYLLSYIDVLQSFAYISEKNKYVRPILMKERMVDLVDSRHPVVEKVKKSEYVSNDIKFDNNTNILLITGPNMAGKSTYMRQLGVIVIMAQVGCFVPAKEAKLPIFDKIFTRIGASDDLVSGESTFMVEMMEANNALANSTNNSLLLFDELGRGTATYDGMAIAQSILEYLDENIQAKVIFSTHYHELTNLESNLKSLKNIHVSALEENDKITFLHKVKDGSVDKSYGIHVAALANLPTSLIKRATNILSDLEQQANSNIKPNKEVNEESQKLNVLTSKPVESKVEELLKQINLVEISPMEAFNLIGNLKEMLK